PPARKLIWIDLPHQDKKAAIPQRWAGSAGLSPATEANARISDSAAQENNGGPPRLFLRDVALVRIWRVHDEKRACCGTQPLLKARASNKKAAETGGPSCPC